MMNFYIVAILFGFAKTSDNDNDTDNDCIIIRNQNYIKEILKDEVRSPYQLAIDHETNTLFFSFTAWSGEMFQTAYLSLNTKEFGVVTGIQDGFSNAVDSKSGTVYMGGENGIYKFYYDTKKAVNLNIIKSINVWQMFFKDGLYFTTYPDEKAYLYKDDKVVEVPEVRYLKVTLIAVDFGKNIVYANSSGVFMIVNDPDHTDLILKKNVIVNGITSDIYGNLYFSTANGLYYINDETKTVETIAKFKNIYGIAIDHNGHIIYGAAESIIKLKPTKKECYN